MFTRVMQGRGVLERLGPALDDLHRAASIPITARRVWLETWASCYSGYEPWAIVLEDGNVRLDAAALLARRRRFGVLEIVALGHGPSDSARLAARNRESAIRLGREVAALVHKMPPPWRIHLEQLPTDDAAARTITENLPCAELIPGDGSPAVRFGRSRRPRDYLSANARNGDRTARSRIRRAGLPLEIAHVREAESIARLLGHIQRIHRERDAALMRPSDLDDPRAAAFWSKVIGRLARRGEVQITALRLNGELTAYVVGLLDGPAYRMWDTRFAPAWSKFSPGRLATHAALARVIEDDRFSEFDWMRGMERYKLSTATDVVPAQHLVAWSSPQVRATAALLDAARTDLKRFRDQHAVLQRGWAGVKRRFLARRWTA